MPSDSRRRLLLRAGLLLGAAPLWRPASACEFFTGTLRIQHPWTRATADDATEAVLCMTIDEVSVDDRLIGVDTPVARGAEIGGAQPRATVDLALPAQRTTVLDEQGTFVRLTGLRHPLGVGRSYPLELTFQVGGTVRATLNVDYPAFRFG